ncbi:MULTISPECIES: DUF4350 domain-containing protein [Arthrobacter]|uniref:DUF4350 domain-containing protein n=1 Tax=Arthrobacter psychrochitiniphilus TaxID=291045 RepID=A0A2V3DPH4_9MICC|nr:DUF4350 domain-containing protein [Arthrobacter psychrochitiniphilus]NYG18368.1 hypothetical protein [Arthrobacter psychrochitiniphilus]PXA64581.1 hypothetical protein CVS29_14710 [Arthrobacter psychrochitiniphilus]
MTAPLPAAIESTASALAVPESSNGPVFQAENSTPRQRLAHWWRHWRFWLIVGAVFVLLSVLTFLAATSGNRSLDALAINNPAPAGAQAAASVLENQGVNVMATDSLAKTTAALSHNAYGASTVLFYDPRNILTPAQVSELAASVEENGSRLLAITPGPLTLKRLSPDFSAAGSTAGSSRVDAGCTNADAQAARSISGGGTTSALNEGPPSGTLRLYKGAQTCFSPASGSSPAGGGLLASNSSGDIFALGFSGVVNNHYLDQAGNAALTFRLLGSRPELLWYTASLNDIPPAQSPPSLAELTPTWMFPAAAWLMLVAVVGALWRGRRNGPLVQEPLPVIVKASETMAGRARLYQDARAVETATNTLRHASMTRLAHALRLGHGAEPAAVVEAVAIASRRPSTQVHAILLGAAPTSEKDMLTIAAELAALEEEVARR